jgi:hypothetical protein
VALFITSFTSHSANDQTTDRRTLVTSLQLSVALSSKEAVWELEEMAMRESSSHHPPRHAILKKLSS